MRKFNRERESVKQFKINTLKLKSTISERKN